MEKRKGETIGIVLFNFLFIFPALSDFLTRIFPDFEYNTPWPFRLLLSLLILLLIFFIDGMLRKNSLERNNTYYYIRLCFYFLVIISGITLFILRLIKKA
jgi:hypothetical protein